MGFHQGKLKRVNLQQVRYCHFLFCLLQELFHHFDSMLSRMKSKAGKGQIEARKWIVSMAEHY